MNSVLLWIGGLLIAALGLLFAVPYVVDWNAYRGVFEEEASRVLGRDVRVGGKVNLRLLPAPYVRFEKVRVSDTDAVLGEPFFRAESFTLWLSAMPLLRGAIEANEIELDRPVLRLSIDAAGNGNWQSLPRAGGVSPFMPSDVVLQQIKVRNGIVSLRSHDRVEPSELTGIDGEVSATSLAGPYRFRGQVAWNTIVRELRVAIAQPETDGRLRFRAVVRVPESNNSYTFDGGLSEVTTRAKLDGTLTARLPIAAIATPGTIAGKGKDAAKPKSASEQNAFDLKAAVTGNLDSVRLSDIALAFEQDGKPQLVTGEASASWKAGQRFEVRLASRWLDLDQISGQGVQRPLEATRVLIDRIGAILPVDGTTFATLDVEQVNLGGEAVSGVRLALARAAGRTSIGELKAALPGNARASIRGVLGGEGDARSFEGEIILRGSSYQRFSAWASRASNTEPAAPSAGGAAATAVTRGDGAFSLASRLKMLPDRLEMPDASIEFAGAQLQGDLDWGWGAQKELRVAIDGATVDVSALAPGLLDLDSWRGARGTSGGAVAGGAATAATSPLTALAAKARLVNAAVGNLRITVRAQTLTDGVDKLRDVDANLSFEPDALVIPGLKFISGDGVVVDVQGDFKSLESKPTGRLKGWLSAKGAPSVQALASALATNDNTASANWGSHASRVDLGFSAAIGGAGNNDQLTIRANGTVDDGRLDLALTLAGGLNAWRDAPVDLTLHVDSPEMPNLVRRLLAGREPAPGIVGPDTAEGNLVIKVVGSSAATLASFAQLDANGLGLAFNGIAKLGADDSVDLTGDLGIAAADAGDVFTLLGTRHRPLLSGIGVDGVLGVVRDGGKARFETRALTVGSSRISGYLTMAAKGERLAVDGQLAVDQASIPIALGLILDGREAASSAAPRDEPGADVVSWPETAFALGVLDALEGRVGVTTPTLEIGNGLTVSDASLSFELEPGRVGLRRLTGKVLGGQLTASSTIERAPGGATVSVDAQLTGARLAELTARTADDRGRNLGDANASLRLEGRGASPRAAIAVMTGRGEIDLRNAKARGVATTAIDKTAQTLIDGAADISRNVLEQAIRGAFKGAELDIASRKLPIEAVDGTLRIGPLQIETPDARIRNQTVVDLASAKLDSEWQIAPRRPLAARPSGSSAQPSGSPRSRVPLPPVTLVWSGPLARLTALEPQLSIETLEREITVRKMERDVERLEDLRRQDEERARLEADRLRRFDESAQGPGANAASQVPPVIQAPFPIQATPLAPLQAPAGRSAGPPVSVGPRAAPRDLTPRDVQ